MSDENLSYIPSGDHALKPYLCVRGAAEAIAFYVEVFGAIESPEHRFVDADGKVGHSELRFGDSLMYLADEYPGYGMSPIDLPDSVCSLYLHVPDCDAVTAKAEAAGATVLQAPEDSFHGARRSTLRDPFGHRWMIVTQTSAISTEDYEKAKAQFARTPSSEI
jgi:PhnB protein